MSQVALRLQVEAEANTTWLAQIVRAQRDGRSCLPKHLGLDAAQYAGLLARHGLQPAVRRANYRLLDERDALREELLALRQEEWQALHDLLLAGQDDLGEPALAAIVAAACLGSEHLWRDLGLDSRAQLRALLMYNFPHLARRNTQDMRWKKFFYKQLCEQGGGYVCRAPSCDTCPTYHDCFGEEQ
ncbi:nitrogen fixation protein NifQ [Pseudomonas stutzeri]|jgi:nitrogen fixation protein NifQ|uniref:Nitrogen fixation protein NifQ n=1 Tax=Stutzerimonas stutzeri NF13 TaxID=1212548 RepID=M2VGX0_STUST|nr:nitrogen fixation protein NifQ [Stutzerimonas stutzeri]EMD98913.1 nitrogen fixation protein NifQ [Stutzerimonas stutzeri NF13]MBK3880508.1 nitrogen fixation protein NifQ [Stutzerimonas stutzeri]MCQ4291914.1 nitrogen fixation protein NifQ [Stutzerimonas stutzeri]WOF80079.1 nitrogen fixation protein NifQ [Pseudomonas sp. FeN3W]